MPPRVNSSLPTMLVRVTDEYQATYEMFFTNPKHIRQLIKALQDIEQEVTDKYKWCEL